MEAGAPVGLVRSVGGRESRDLQDQVLSESNPMRKSQGGLSCSFPPTHHKEGVEKKC